MATGCVGSGVTPPAADDEENNKLMCAICLEKYRRPKLLPCFHTFCQSCLQGMVGSSPSFACPSCRTLVVLPPGGVRALQTNFYIEEDLSYAASSPQRRLCEVCTEDKDATHTCLQCQQKFCLPCRRCHDAMKVCQGHTMVSLDRDEEAGCGQGGASSVKEEQGVEMCPKHPSQQLLLRCEQCERDICIQCKLTQHDGHPTQDLTDIRTKARTSLQDMMATVMQQRQQINHLIHAFSDRRDKLQCQQQETLQDCKGKTDVLHQWVNQSLDEAATSIQTSTRELDQALQDQVEQLQSRDTALQAQQDYVMRVLNDGKEADLVALEGQVNDSLLKGTDFKRIEKELTKDIPKLHVRNNSSAVNQVQLREFVGVLEPVQPETFQRQSDSAAGSAGLPVNGSQAAKQKKQPRQFVYSKNPQSIIVAMCPIVQNRLWVAYRSTPDSALMMKLFDANGQVVTTVNTVKTSSGLVPQNNNVLSWSYNSDKIQIIKADGELLDFTIGCPVGCLVLSACNDKIYLRIHGADKLNQVDVLKVGPGKLCTKSKFGGNVCSTLPGFNLPVHVSSNGEYVAVVKDFTVHVCTKATESFSSYVSPLKNDFPRSVCFCEVGGQEQLLVIFDGHVRVHIVDHIDGGMLVGYLNTGPVDLYKPRRLATDFDQHLWIGCDGGKVVMVDLKMV